MKAYEKQGLTKNECVAIHQWLLRNREKGEYCYHCGKNGVKLDNALLRGKNYEKNIHNYITLCRFCHRKYDNLNIKISLPIRNFITREVFDSISDAAIKYGVSYGTIRYWLLKGENNPQNLIPIFPDDLIPQNKNNIYPKNKLYETH